MNQQEKKKKEKNPTSYVDTYRRGNKQEKLENWNERRADKKHSRIIQCSDEKS